MAENVSLVEERGQTGVQIDVPFPEHAWLYQPPKVIMYTKQPERYRVVLQ